MSSDRRAIGDPALDLVVRRQDESDASFLRALFTASARAVLAPAGLAEPALAQLVEMQWRAQSAAYASAFPNARGWIAVQGGERAGRLLEADDTGGVHIIDIAVSPARQRRGVGTALVRTVKDRLAAGGEVCAEVAVGNLASLALFESLDFSSVVTPGAPQVGVSWRATAQAWRYGD